MKQSRLTSGVERVDGGAGLMISIPNVTVTVSRADELRVNPARLTEEVNFVLSVLQVEPKIGLRIHMSDKIPNHCV